MKIDDIKPRKLIMVTDCRADHNCQCEDGMPVRVVSICLPYLIVAPTAFPAHTFTIDVRCHKFATVTAHYAKNWPWKTEEEMLAESATESPDKCIQELVDRVPSCKHCNGDLRWYTDPTTPMRNDWLGICKQCKSAFEADSLAKVKGVEMECCPECSSTLLEFRSHVVMGRQRWLWECYQCTASGYVP